MCAILCTASSAHAGYMRWRPSLRAPAVPRRWWTSPPATSRTPAWRRRATCTVGGRGDGGAPGGRCLLAACWHPQHTAAANSVAHCGGWWMYCLRARGEPCLVGAGPSWSLPPCVRRRAGRHRPRGRRRGGALLLPLLRQLRARGDCAQGAEAGEGLLSLRRRAKQAGACTTCQEAAVGGAQQRPGCCGTPPCVHVASLMYRIACVRICDPSQASQRLSGRVVRLVRGPPL